MHKTAINGTKILVGTNIIPESAKMGVNVIVFDENKKPGGQLLRYRRKIFTK
ncbi:unnamed protein product [marine sediment metagenome]|uniref:Uncharacterized protein n=1 Tax=marine sediment metagenome TaxID=412755 RepID=X1TY61_9ZZZZ